MPGDPPPEKEKLPLFESMEHCIALAEERADAFYVIAYMLQSWMGRTMSHSTAQYAEHKSGDRRLQDGAAWHAWQQIFGAAAPEEWPLLLDAMARFMKCDTPAAELLTRAYTLAQIEDRDGDAVFMQTHRTRFGATRPPPAELVALGRYVFQRISEWLEAVVHWRAHVMSQRVPVTNQPTGERRELAQLGVMQANYAGLSEHARAWWQFRHAELARQFQGKPEWRLVGEAQSMARPGELRQPAVDELTIHWWPLLQRHRWTDRDLRGLLRRVVPHPDAYPLREDKEFADYRKKALGLSKAKEARDRSAPDGNPVGWRVAMAMVGQGSEPEHRD